MDMLVFAGHKGPLGPQGIGGLYVAPNVELLSPAATCDLRAGAAGGGACVSFPSYCDVGSVNLAAAAGLAAGVRWLRERGAAQVLAHVRGLTERLLAGLQAIPGVTIHGPLDPSRRTGAVSITMAGAAGATPAALQALLSAAGITSRAGHHCAPMAHEALGTREQGTLRLSAGVLSTPEHIDAALACLAACVK
jgi:selenocysteine lyase/cysteine desulfurase